MNRIVFLHELEVKGECEILATMESDGYPYKAPTLEVFNSNFLKPGIPVGVPGPEAPKFSCPNHWNNIMIYEPKLKSKYPISI